MIAEKCGQPPRDLLDEAVFCGKGLKYRWSNMAHAEAERVSPNPSARVRAAVLATLAAHDARTYGASCATTPRQLVRSAEHTCIQYVLSAGMMFDNLIEGAPLRLVGFSGHAIDRVTLWDDLWTFCGTVSPVWAPRQIRKTPTIQ